MAVKAGCLADIKARELNFESDDGGAYIGATMLAQDLTDARTISDQSERLASWTRETYASLLEQEAWAISGFRPASRTDQREVGRTKVASYRATGGFMRSISYQQ